MGWVRVGWDRARPGGGDAGCIQSTVVWVGSGDRGKVERRRQSSGKQGGWEDGWVGWSRVGWGRRAQQARVVCVEQSGADRSAEQALNPPGLVKGRDGLEGEFCDPLAHKHHKRHNTSFRPVFSRRCCS